MAKGDKPPPIDLERELMTEPERIEEDRVLKLQTELAELGPGTQVIIERLRPSWCRGQLEKYTVGPEGIDLDYLIRTWGGQLLSIKIVGHGNRIRGSHSVELYSYEPRRRGKLLHEPGYEVEDDEDTPQVVVNSASPAPPDNQLMLGMVQLLNTQHQSQVDTLRTIIAAQIDAASRQSQQSPSALGFSEMIKMMGAFSKLRDMFQQDQPVSDIDPDDAFAQQMMGMLGTFIQGRNENTGRAAIVGPSERPPLPQQRLAPVAPLPAAQRPPAANVVHQPNVNLAQEIAALNPREAAAVLLDALAAMPADRKNQAIAAVWQEFEALQGYDPVDDEYEEDDQAAINDKRTDKGVKQGP